MRDSIDFSKVERIAPRADSWDKVCKRLDIAEKAKVLRFRIYSAIPLAASFALVALSLLLSSVDSIETTAISSQQIASTQQESSTELYSWYGKLGETESDELETLDNSQTLTYLLKEDK